MNTIREMVSTMNSVDLLALKSLIEDKIEENYDLPENFYIHDKTDDYIYIVDYIDGHYHYSYIGAEAYKEYIGSPYATRIRRKTKSLFPVFETMMVKENYEQRGEETIRYELCYDAMQKDYFVA